MKNILRTGLFSLVILSFSIVACKKDSDAPGNNNNGNNNTLSDCNLRNYGTVEIFNNSKGNNAYRLEFSNTSTTYRIEGRAKNKYTLSPGSSVSIKATQLEGYVLYPSVYNTTLKIEKCGNYYWEF